MDFKNETAGILHVCITDTDQTKATVLELYPNCVASFPDTSSIVSGAEIGEVMSAANAVNDTFLEELPEEGEPVLVTYYKYGTSVVYCRQEHTRTQFAPEETPALFYFYRENPEGMEWIEQEMVEVGNTRTYEGETYEVIQGHVTQSDWPPDSTPTLWKLAGTGEVPVWVQPTGGHDAYNAGDEVMFPDANGTHYRSLINANVWSPTVYPAGWEEVV